MNIKKIALVLGLVAFFLYTFQLSVEARGCCSPHFSLNIGGLFAPAPRVEQHYIVERHYAPTAYVYPCYGCEPQVIVIQPRAHCYREMIVERPRPVVMNGFSFSWFSGR